MPQESHDHNFKNVFLDFPREALELFYPQALEQYGELQEITFVRQEPRKRRLSDSGLALDMPILFRFDRGSLLLWLVEFQEDKEKFSIYKLLRYATNLMEAHPDAVVIPTVLFTDRKAWRKDVPRQLESSFAGTTFLHFVCRTRWPKSSCLKCNTRPLNDLKSCATPTWAFTNWLHGQILKNT